MPAVPKRSRKLNKDRVHLRLTQESGDFLRKYAEKSGCTTSELAEMIINEYRATAENYFTKSAAYFGFVSCSLSLIIASKLFEPDRTPMADLDTIKDDITKEAAKLFGEQPPSPFADDSFIGDERLWSLHEAFAAHWLRRRGHLPSIHDVK